MADTTSIHDLPTDPVGGGSIGGNVGFIATENVPPMNNNSSLDQSTINQLVNGLQQVSVTGATTLPSRDIPRSTENLTQDAYIQPNYIPPTPHKDYILEHETNEDILQKYHKEDQTKHALDNVYDEIQVPLLLSILYFIFQLPIVKQTLFKYVPMLSNKDGNMNLNGFVFTSAFFGLIYYGVFKATKFVSRM
jgi:hypothetical protein